VQGLGDPGLLQQLGDSASKRYWICAFCINQHCSICGGFPHEPPHGTQEYLEWDAARRDTVTNEIYLICNCRQQKHFNDSTVECELNKFDRVMEKLLKTPKFGQVVAADLYFEVFERAWCVSELVEADFLNIRQELILHDVDCLHAHCQSLTQLWVRSCKASRVEDQEEIIRNIADTEAFDKRLQWLLFRSTGLLRFHTSDSMSQTAAVAKILKV